MTKEPPNRRPNDARVLWSAAIALEPERDGCYPDIDDAIRLSGIRAALTHIGKEGEESLKAARFCAAALGASPRVDEREADMKLLPYLTIAIAAFAPPAFAHVGHLGDVAGHSHWIGLAAAAGAAVLAAWLAGTRKKPEEKTETAADGETEGKTEEAQA